MSFRWLSGSDWWAGLPLSGERFSFVYFSFNAMSNQPAQMRSDRVNWLGPAALLLVLCGWVVAILYAGGLELHRSAVAMPLVVAGALIGLWETIRSGRSVPGHILLAGVPALLYFILRALFSPVWDLGRHDLHLISMAWLTIVTVSTCTCLLYTSPSPRDGLLSRMPSSG